MRIQKILASSLALTSSLVARDIKPIIKEQSLLIDFDRQERIQKIVRELTHNRLVKMCMKK